MNETRIDRRFQAMKAAGRSAFIAFVSAGDPDRETSLAIIKALPGAGADLIELGMPFTDPMADGPTIQQSSLRALAAGITVKNTLDLVARFRETDDQTPIILFGYYNPIHHFGRDAFLSAAREAGVDGLIIVDLPPEEDAELCLPAMANDLNFIRLATPTTDDDRLPTVLRNASGFLYYVSITGITGAATPDTDVVKSNVARLRKQTDLPIAVGFGINTPEDAAKIAQFADATVVGSAICRRIGDAANQGKSCDETVRDVVEFVKTLAQSVHQARD